MIKFQNTSSFILTIQIMSDSYDRVASIDQVRSKINL